MSSDLERYQRLMVPFVKRAVATANGAAAGTTIVAIQLPAIGEFGLGEADGFWNDAEVLVLTGDMKDQVRRVTTWVQVTGTLTVDHRFNNPNVSLLSANVLAAAVIIPVVNASVFSAGEAYIWDAVNAETVTITIVDTVLNQLTIAAGLTNPYTVAAGAAISMSPRILGPIVGPPVVPGMSFLLMTATKTEDTGVHTNPEKWLHDHHWDSGVETVLNAAAAVNFGAVVAAGLARRVREITVRNTAQANTVITLSVGAVNRLSFDVPQGTTRTWSSQDGRLFAAGQQVQIASSAAGAGTETFVTASGVEAAQS